MEGLASTWEDYVFQFNFFYAFVCCHFRIPQCSCSQHEHFKAGSAGRQEVQIRLLSLRPHEKIKIVAETIDDNEICWTSHALFRADEKGKIDLCRQPPLKGTYEGVDGMGLFWSMQPSESNRDAAFKIKGEKFTVKLTAYRKDEQICSQEIVRLRKAKDVKKIAVREDGLNAIWFMPDSQKKLPIIIVLSGSNGGYGENRAQLVASHGFHTLALAYFGEEGLTHRLQEVPLEYFERVFEWLKNQPQIDAEHVGIYGVSRGAELALILGSWFPDSVHAIAAVVPSSVVNGGLGDAPVHAWTYRDRPLCPFAYVPRVEFKGMMGKDRDHAVGTMRNFVQGMKDSVAFQAAAIPVEKMKASLLLVSGGDDQMWPSAIYAEKILERLTDNGSDIVRRHLYYADAGHGINIPNLPQPGPAYYHPVGKIWLSMGGTAEDDQYASADSWKKMIHFFQTHLKTEAK